MIFILVVAFFTVANAQTTLHPNKACCVSNKFTSTMLELGASLQPNSTDPEIRQGFTMLDFDYDVKMSKLNSYIINQQTGKYENVAIYNDYPNDKIFTVSGDQCHISPISASGRTEMTKPCIPSNFTYERTYRIGPPSSNPLMVDVFEGQAGGLAMDMHVQSDDCTPILQSFYGQADLLGDLGFTTYIFADVQQNTLSSSNPFDLPDACKSGAAPVGK